MKVYAYTADDINLISSVQTIALKTALPIVLLIFKQFCKETISKCDTLSVENVVKNIQADPYIIAEKYDVSEDFIKKAIGRLVSDGFLEQSNDIIRVTGKGKRASVLLLGVLDEEDL